MAENRKVDQDGVTFKSHIDGSIHRITPEKSIAIQENLGADIIMAFDECASPYDRDYILRPMHRTHVWAERCLRARTRPDQALFGIVQVGIFEDLRRDSANVLVSMDFPGYAIGGLSVGESKEHMYHVLETVTPCLPSNKPRYLMGVGTAQDLIEGVARGEAKKYHELSLEALKSGDRPAYEAANKLANEAFSKSFFMQVAVCARFFSPLFFALGWMQNRFLEVEFPLPFVGFSLGYIGVFVLLYVAAYFLLKPGKRLFFRGVRAVSSGRAPGAGPLAREHPQGNST